MAILGSGDIATALREENLDRDYLTFMASGVSNSRETRQECFDREKDLLRRQDKLKQIVYFSSLSVYYSDTPYALHKINMEQYLNENFLYPTIVRIGNISFGKNPNTLINFFKNKMSLNEPVEVQNVYRYILSKQEFSHWIKMIRKDKKDTMNIPGALTYVPDLFEDIKNGKYGA